METPLPKPDSTLAQAPRWAIDRLSKVESSLQPMRRRFRRYRTAALVALVALLCTAGAGFAALSGAFNSFKGVYGEVHKYDTTTFSFDQATTGMAPIAYSAAFTTPGAPAEMDLALATASTAVPQNDWFYQINAKEVSAAVLGSGNYKAELFVNGVSKGALYFSQATALPVSIEGVTLRWDLGTTLSSAATYVVKVTTV